MSVFLFRYAKVSDARSIREVDLAPHLPRAAISEEYLVRGAAEIRIASFGAALDKPPAETSDGFTFAQGYLPSVAFPELGERLLDTRPITLLDYPESFCAVTYRRGAFGFTSAGTGADQLFYFDAPDAFFVTNRHNLLGPFVEHLTLRKESFWWMAGRTHLGDSGSYWDQIQRTMPSRKYLFDGSLHTIETDYSGLFDPIPATEVPDAMADIVSHFDRVLEDVPAAKRLSLTGGKDSRAILGLMSGIGQAENLKANTSGALFSPDVMSARHLSEALGISHRHSISRPRVAQPAGDIAGRVADDLLLDFAGRSLADISKFSFAGDLVLGGHEAGIKSPLNDRSLDTFVHARRYWADDRKVLAPEVRRQLILGYQERLRETLADVPPAYFDKIEGLEYRLPHRNSANITASHVGGSQLHPFYDGKIVRIICGLDPEILGSQYIPYYFTALAQVDIVSPRFADDAWPEQLHSLVAEHNLVKNGRYPRARLPYRFRPYFPTEKRFGMFDHRIDLCDMSSHRLLEYVHDNRAFFDYLDMDQVIPLVSKGGSEKTFREMYVHLGLLKSALVHAVSSDLFSFDAHSTIASSVESFLSVQDRTSSVSSPSPDQAAVLEDRIRRYEASIGEMEESIVRAEEDAAESDVDVTNDFASESLSRNHDEHANSTFGARFGFSDVLAASRGDYFPIPNGGLHVATVDSSRPLELTGQFFGQALTKRSALVLIENATVAPFSSLLYSKKLGGYFRYISLDPATGDFRVDLQPVAEQSPMQEIRVSLHNWRNEGPLLIAGTPVLTLQDERQSLA